MVTTNESAFSELKNKLPNNHFLFDNKEYFCVDTKIMRGVNLVIFTKNDKTIVLYYKHEAEKITIETEQEKLNRKSTNNTSKYSAELFIEKPKQSRHNKPVKIITAINSKLPLSLDMREYLFEKYKDLSTSLDEREWSEEEESLVFRESSKMMSHLLNRSIPTINKMKKRSLAKQSEFFDGSKIKESNVDSKPLSKTQIEYFTKKYNTINCIDKETFWTDEELQLIFRGKTRAISIMLNRNVNSVYGKRREIIAKNLSDNKKIFEELKTA